jgi:protein involved in polysaccharide export with SLBB domain
MEVAYPAAPAAEAYRVGCPDVLFLECPGRPELAGERAIDARGGLDLGPFGNLRVEGLTAAEVAQLVAQKVRGPARVAVVEFRRQHVYLFGEVEGRQRAVPYQGPETVVSLLRRAGGLTKDGAPGQVYLVRNPRLDDQEPQVFHVDLQAILLRGDERTNVVVHPQDQVYVPETKQAKLGKCLPPWLRPVAQAVTPGM